MFSDLISEVNTYADAHTDGHWTMFKFTTGYKAVFGTPTRGRVDLSKVPSHDTAAGALRALLEKPISL